MVSLPLVSLCRPAMVGTGMDFSQQFVYEYVVNIRSLILDLNGLLYVVYVHCILYSIIFIQQKSHLILAWTLHKALWFSESQFCPHIAGAAGSTSWQTANEALKCRHCFNISVYVCTRRRARTDYQPVRGAGTPEQKSAFHDDMSATDRIYDIVTSVGLNTQPFLLHWFVFKVNA